MSKTNQQKVSRIIYLVLLTAVFLIISSPFAIPVIFAGSVSLTLYPVLVKLEARGLSRKHSAALLTTFFAIVISIPLFFFVVKGTVAVTDQLEKISFTEIKAQGMEGIVSDMRHDVVVSVHKLAEKFNFADFFTPKKIDYYLNMVSTFLLNFFRTFASSIPLFFLYLLVMVLCTFSFLNHSSGIRSFFQNIFGFTDEKMAFLVNVFIKDSRQVYISNLATGGIQSLIVATGAAILNIGSFFLIFFITLILSFIPVVGAAPVAFVCAIVAYLKGETTHAIILVVLGAFTGIVDNFLRPWLASFGESHIPPMAAFICVLGGALLLGFPGLFIGLLVGSLAYDTLPLMWDEISRPGREEL